MKCQQNSDEFNEIDEQIVTLQVELDSIRESLAIVLRIYFHFCFENF